MEMSKLTGKAAILAAAICVAAALPAFAEATVVAAGENVSVTDATAYRFKHYRLKIDDCMGTTNCLQLSEFRLLNGNEDVTALRSGFSFGEGMDDSSNKPANALDGDTGTKWLTFSGSSSSDMSKCWLQIDYENPQPVTAYDWATANDRWYNEISNDRRDPRKFHLLGSDDGETWTELDYRDIGAKDLTRYWWTGPYAVLNDAGAWKVEGGTLTVASDAEISGIALQGGVLAVPEGRIARLAGDGTGVDVAFTATTRGSLVVDGTLDVNGHFISVGVLSGHGAIVNSSSASGGVVFGADGSDASYTGGISIASGVTIAKEGVGSLAYNGLFLKGSPVTVSGGTFSLQARTAKYRKYRFVIDDCIGANRNSMQFSEFRLLCDGADVTSRKSGFSVGPGADDSPNNSPANAVDGNLSTKWLTFAAGGATAAAAGGKTNCWLQVDFAEAQEVTAYDWATGNDNGYSGRSASSCRDPRKFRLLGSDDGVAWSELDSRDIGAKNMTRSAWTGPYVLAEALGKTTVSGGTFETLKDIGAASVAQCGGAVRIADGCTMTLANGGVWSAPSFAPGSKGAVDSLSSSTNYMTVADTEFTGNLNVKTGTLSFDIGTPDRLFRLTLKRVVNNDCAQLSRVMVYDKDGNNLALGLAKVDAGTDPAALPPGTCAYAAAYSEGGSSSVEHLFDGSTSTKMCLTGLTKGAEFSRIIYFRLPASATAAACSYQFTTANDNTPGRNPKLWTLESSADGVAWKTVDARTEGEFTSPSTTYTDFNGGTPMLFRSVPGTVSFAEGAFVSVASSAALDFGDVQCELRGLRIDCATGIGTLSNFSPAASGVLLLENVPEGTSLRTYTIPFSPETTSNGENLRSWDVYVNGAKVNFRARLAENAIKFVSGGLMVIVR